MGCSCKSRASRSSCCSASEVVTGGLVGVTEDFFLAAGRFWVLTCRTACCVDGDAMPGFEAQKHTAHNKAIGNTKNMRTLILSRGAAREDTSSPGVLNTSKLAPQNRRGIGILAEVFWVSLAQNFDHPIVEIIDRMAQDRLKTPVIFFVSLFDIIPQTQANVLMFASQTDLIRTEHFNILHGNLGDAIRPPVQILLLWLQRRNVKRRSCSRQLLYRVGRRTPPRDSRSLSERCGALPSQVRCMTPPNPLRRRGVYPRIDVSGS